MPVRVVLAGPDTAPLRNLAATAGLHVVGEAPGQQSAQSLARDRSASVIVYAGIPDELAEVAIPTVVVAPEEEIGVAASTGALAVVPEHCSAAVLAAAVETASGVSRMILEARAEAEALQDQLETRKLVERAKGILMQRLNLSEPDAYRKLQKASQDENRKMRDVADSIVRTEKILAENVGRKSSGEASHRTAG